MLIVYKIVDIGLKPANILKQEQLKLKLGQDSPKQEQSCLSLRLQWDLIYSKTKNEFNYLNIK